eukprot:GSChrysophyteH2.ASY1.ANO1.580.1 assembled CDS
MKAIAVAALSGALETQGEIMAAGILTSLIVMLLGITNLITLVDAFIPKPVVRGLQLGLGLSMFQKALDMCPDGLHPTFDSASWMGWDGYLVAFICVIVCVVTAKSRWFPTAFAIFFVGVVVAAVRMKVDDDVEGFQFGFVSMHTVVPTSVEWRTGLFSGALPQVPTTLLNSCIAVVKLSETIYPERSRKKQTGLSLRSVSTSVGVMNSIFCWFGGYPMCHGSGGLAGQHRFGARTNLSIIVLGLSKLTLGVFFGKGLLGLLNLFPKGMLAALLAAASWELSVSGREGLKGSIDEARSCIVTTAFVTYYGQAIGIILGIFFSYLAAYSDLYFGTQEQIDAAVLQYARGVKERRKIWRACKATWRAQYLAPCFGVFWWDAAGAAAGAAGDSDDSDDSDECEEAIEADEGGAGRAGQGSDVCSPLNSC